MRLQILQEYEGRKEADTDVEGQSAKGKYADLLNNRGGPHTSSVLHIPQNMQGDDGHGYKDASCQATAHIPMLRPCQATLGWCYPQGNGHSSQKTHGK